MLTAGQRAMCFAMMRPEPGRPGRPKKGNTFAAKAFSYARLSGARKVLRFSYELAESVMSGEKTLDAALKLIEAEQFKHQKTVALHESAHCIVGLALGLSCRGMTMMPANCKTSNTLVHGKVRPEKYSIHALAMCSMAGAIAEQDLLKRNCNNGDATDNANIAKLISDERLKARLRSFTRQLVRRHALPMIYLASVLLKVKNISGEHITDWWTSVRTKHLVINASRHGDSASGPAREKADHQRKDLSNG
jgi:hypothetical protein